MTNVALGMEYGNLMVKSRRTPPVDLFNSLKSVSTKMQITTVTKKDSYLPKKFQTNIALSYY